MEKGIIQADPRHIARRIKTAMQGNAIRALVELITNSDDSYIKLEEDGESTRGLIEICYKKDGYCGLFEVRDYAMGMSIEKVRESFKKYGAATSGMMTGSGVRGYFGQGAKDALASMEDGKICTFNNGKFVECKIFMKDGEANYEISDSIDATQNLRNRYKIDKNGTVAYFRVDPQKGGRVPQFNTVHQELANSYLLRKIMTNPHRKIYLVDYDSSDKKRSLRYQMPEGKEILADTFNISYDSYKDFPIKISIHRAGRELTQVGDDRDGGLLLADDKNAVLGISMFKYDNEPLAAHFFGEVVIEHFRELLEKEEPVLREERDGIIASHPFCQKLIGEIENRIETKVKEEKIRKQKEEQGKIDREEIGRYKKAFTILNEIAEVEAQDTIFLGDKPTDIIEEPPNGFALSPLSAQITVGKRYVFQLRLNTKVVHHGSTIKIASSNSKIRVFTPEVKLFSEDGVGILQKYITVEGAEPNIEGIIQASTNGKLAQAKVYVVPEKELLLSEGMVFQPETLTLRPNQPRKVCLFVYVKMIEGGSEIKISSENPAVHISADKITVNGFDAVRHIAKHELEIWGEGAGQDTIIKAEHETYLALLEVQIRSKEDRDEKSRKGMFSEPEYNSYEPEPLQRTTWSAETGKVTIYVNFPSVKHYVGENGQYKKALPSQVFLADLVAERCFYEIAKKKVDSSGALIRPEARLDKIQSETYVLSRKHGKKVHEVLVDQDLLKTHQRRI